MRTLLLAGVVAVCAALVSPASGAEILVNGGFETGSLSPWFIGRSFGTTLSGWATSTNAPQAGSYDATVNGNQELRQNFTAISTSSISNVSFYARSSAVVAAYDLFYSDGTDVENFVNITSAWTYLDVTTALTPGKNLTGFSVFGNTNAPLFFDTASITANLPTSVPEPASLALLALPLGAAGMIAKRRRRASVS